jgi:hypothetical protein
MKIPLRLFMVSICSITFLASCKDDEPKIDPIVGEWELNEVNFSDAPADFSRFNGTSADNIYGETKYVITLNSDQTYIREVRIDGKTYEDDGEWELDDEELILDQDDSDTDGFMLDFIVEEEITIEELVISGTITTRNFTDEIFNDPEALDTLDTQEKFDAFAAEYLQTFSITATLELEKQK